MRKKKVKDAVGQIYYVDPKHLVKPEDRNNYEDKRDPNHKRPVIIGKHNRRTNAAQVSKLTTVVPTDNQKRRHYQVELPDTPSKSGKSNYADTRVIAKSAATNKKFKIGEEPLNKNSGSISDKDLKKYKSARKKRYPGIK